MLWLVPLVVWGVDKQKGLIRMSRRTLKTDDEAGFLLAIYDDVSETEAMFGVKVKLEFKRTNRRGCFQLHASAWKDVGQPAERCVATWVGEYPTASANRLHAGLYRAAIGIGASCGRAGLPYREDQG